MGISLATAIIIASATAGGAALIQAEQQRSQASKERKQARALAAGQNKGTEEKKITPGDVTNKGARAALVVGGASGILQQSSTGGRGTLLGN